jgi:hypothetical protein
MDIKAMAARGVRQLLGRATGRLLLLLVFLLPLNAGAWHEPHDVICGNGELSTYIGDMRVAKNIVISYSQKEYPIIDAAHYFGRFRVIGDNFPCFSCLSWPYCRYCRLFWLALSPRGAIGNSITFSIINCSLDDGDASACAPASGRSKPIVPKPITKDNRIGIWVEYGSVGGRNVAGRSVAIYRIGCQSKAGKNGPDIGAELALSGIARYVNRVSTGDYNKRSEERIGDSRNCRSSSPFQTFPIMFTMLAFGSLIAAFKGVYRDSDLMIFGGTAAAIASGSILMVWVLSHLPLDFTFSRTCYLILSHDFHDLIINLPI